MSAYLDIRGSVNKDQPSLRTCHLPNRQETVARIRHLKQVHGPAALLDTQSALPLPVCSYGLLHRPQEARISRRH